MIRDQIIKLIKKASGEPNIQLEFPENQAFGDYSTNVALVLAKKENKSPREVAEEIVAKLKSLKELNVLVDKIEVAGPGFINFWLKKDVLIDNLIQIAQEKEKYGNSNIGKGKIVIIDYSSPNIAKPFGIGHLRSTIIGQALYNLYKTLGYDVIGDNHLGDWGTQFGKLIYMIKKKNVKDFDIQKLEELYVEFHKESEDEAKAEQMESGAREWFKKLEEGDKEARQIWQKCVDISLDEFNRIYKILGINIDFAFGESYYESEMKELMSDPKVQRTLESGEDGAEIVDLSSEGIKTPLMFLKSDGATTYATRDLATLRFRQRKWAPYLVIYEVGVEQTLHFQQVFAAAKLLGIVPKDIKLFHTAHGLYLAPDGKKFSTRHGKTIMLEEVLDEAVERARKLGNNSEEVAKQVGVGAIKYFDLMHSVQSDVVFDWDKIMNMEGNSGPYLQYTFARCNSVIQKAHDLKGFSDAKSLQGSSEKINSEEEILLRTLIKFDEIILSAASGFSPNLLCNYLFDVASKFNSFYNTNRILGSENETFRLSLTNGVGQVLKNGLKLLGIECPEKM